MASSLGTTASAIDSVLKELYKDSLLFKQVFEKRPVLGMLEKFEGFGGKRLPIPIIYGDSQAVSSDFATAQGILTSTSYGPFTNVAANAVFELTRVKKYGLGSISREALLAAKGDATSFVNAVKLAVDSAMNGLANALETALFDSGSGALVKMTVSGTTVTLQQPEEISRIEPGMVLSATATAESGSVEFGTSANVDYVVSVNRSAGSFVVASGSGWATNDWCYRAGDSVATVAAASTAAGAKNIAGLDFWIGNTTYGGSTNNTKFGLDTSVDSRLAGLAYDGSALSISDALLDAVHIAGREGGAPDIAIINHAHYRKLVKEREGLKYDVVMNATSAKGLISTIGYKGVIVEGLGSSLSIMPANKCQGTRGYVLTKEHWCLNSLGPALSLVDEDGKSMLRQAADDGFEIRTSFMGNLSCNAPGRNVKVTLGTP
jgi:hypothetical protein